MDSKNLASLISKLISRTCYPERYLEHNLTFLFVLLKSLANHFPDFHGQSTAIVQVVAEADSNHCWNKMYMYDMPDKITPKPGESQTEPKAGFQPR